MQILQHDLRYGSPTKPFASYKQTTLDSCTQRWDGIIIEGQRALARSIFYQRECAGDALDGFFGSFKIVIQPRDPKRPLGFFRVQHDLIRDNSEEESFEWLLFFEIDTESRLLYYLGAASKRAFYQWARVQDFAIKGVVRQCWIVQKNQENLIEPKQPFAWVESKRAPSFEEIQNEDSNDAMEVTPPTVHRPPPVPVDPTANLPTWAKVLPSFYPLDEKTVPEIVALLKGYDLEEYPSSRVRAFMANWESKDEGKRTAEVTETMEEMMYFGLEETDAGKRILVDLVSRFALAYYGFAQLSMSEYVRDWYIQRELEVFTHYAASYMTNHESVMAYLSALDLLDKVIKLEPFDAMSTELRRDCEDAVKRTGEFTNLWFSVDFRRCLSLMKRHTCFTYAGRTYLTWRQVRDFFLPDLLRDLMLRHMRRKHTVLAVRPIVPVPMIESARAAAEDAAAIIDKPIGLPAELCSKKPPPDIEDLHRLHALPLCTQIQYMKLTGNESVIAIQKRAGSNRRFHLKDQERLAYAPVLKEIGYTPEEVMKHISKYEGYGGAKEGKIKADYAFNVFHPAGRRGEHGMGCKAIMSEKTSMKIRSIECAGCPYKSLHASELDDLLERSGIEDPSEREPIVETAKVAKNYHAACVQHLVSMHGVPDAKLFPDVPDRPSGWALRALYAKNALV